MKKKHAIWIPLIIYMLVPVHAAQQVERLDPAISAKLIKDQTKEVKKMISLGLKITIDKTTVLAGEPVNALVTFSNSGPNPIGANEQFTTYDFEYTLRNKGEGEDLFLSKQQALLDKLKDPVPTVPREFIKLQPSESKNYEIDIAELNSQSVPVGIYALSVSYGVGSNRIESDTVDLNVEKINVRSVSMSIGSYLNDLSMVFSNFDSNAQSLTVYQKESWPEIPYDGVFYQRSIFSEGSLPNGLSAAIKLGETNDQRWIAWLNGNALNMQIGQRQQISMAIDSIETSLQHTQLYPVGWQLSMPEAYFAVMGLDKQQHLTLSLIKNDEYSGKAIIYPVLLDMNKLPNRWKLKNIFGKDRNVTSYLLLETIENGISKVEMLILKPLLGTVVKRYTLPGITGKLEALSMNPISIWFETELEAEEKEDVDVIVDLLFKTDEKNPQMTFMRFSDKHEKPVIQHTFPVIKDKNNQPASHWTLSPAPLDNPQAIAILENSIIAKKLTDDSPAVVLSENSSGAKYLNLELIGEELWAIWVDPESGFEYIPIRP